MEEVDLFSYISKDNPLVKVVDAVTISSREHLHQLSGVSPSLFLRKPSSKYMEHDSLFKLIESVDALVVSTDPLRCIEYERRGS